MNQDRFLFLELVGEVKEEYISQSSQPWTKCREQRVGSYQRNLAQNGKIEVFGSSGLGKKAACLALIVALGFCLAFHDQVYAAIKRFTTMIGESLRLTRDLTPYTEIIGQTQTQGNLSLTLNEVILDEHRMLASFRWEYEGGEGMQRLRINGTRTRINRISYPNSDAFSVSGNLIGTVKQGSDDSIVLGLDFADLELPEGEVNVHLVVNAEEYPETGTEEQNADSQNYVEKDFIYDFVFSEEELRTQTVKRTLDIAVSDEDGEKLTFTDLTMNDLYCVLVAKVHFSRDDPWIQGHALRLKGEDSLGNPVELSLSGFTEDGICFETSYTGYTEDKEEGMITENEGICRPLIPDKNCAYMDLQLYQSCDPGTEEGDIDAEYEKPDEGSENNSWEPVGEKFRVTVNE